ncbi:MAG: DnaD domain protein [Clostridia bacterium]|nr:DnaD domain protein [Clostridia bacterium]MBO4429492.1 DnaD domain protein [Clostridia bacterium]
MIKLKYGSSVISLPGNVAGKISEATEADMRVIVAIASGLTDAEAIASACKISDEETARALSFWRGAGVIEDALPKKYGRSPSDEAPRVYTGEEISQICDDDKSMDSLINKCREMLACRTFTHADASSVIYMRRDLALDPEYIILLCSYYAKREKITLRFIEKKAISLYDDGIKTVTALERYFADETKRHDTEHLVRQLFGLGERALVPKEREYISNWTLKWNMSEELIRRAYEETVANTERPTLAYANAVLKNWYESGVSSAEQADEQKNEHKKKTQKKQKPKKSDPGFDLDEFFDLAIARGQGSSDK